MLYSDIPPTEAGYYYLKFPTSEVFGKMNAWGVWTIDGRLIGTTEDLLRLEFKFGPKIPKLDEYYELFMYRANDKLENG
jgi:hypothetical protein